TLEDVAKHLVEGVEVALVLDEGGARQKVKVLNLAVGEIGLERLDQRQVFLERDRDLGGFEFVEKGGEHVRVDPGTGCWPRLARQNSTRSSKPWRGMRRHDRPAGWPPSRKWLKRQMSPAAAAPAASDPRLALL